MVAAGVVGLTLTMLPLAARAGHRADQRADYAIGYSAHRTNLAGGQHANFSTMRAFVVQGDGSGTKELAQELVTKPHQYVGFAGWSPDGRQAIRSQESGIRSQESGVILFDMESRKATNITAVEKEKAALGCRT